MHKTMPSPPPAAPKLCLSCAVRRLAKKDERPCASCLLLNVDPFAQVRANAALPSPKLRYPLLIPGGSSRPARSKYSGRVA